MKMTKEQCERLVAAFERMAEDTHANMLINQAANLNSISLRKAVLRSAIASEINAACTAMAHGADGRIPLKVVQGLMKELASIPVEVKDGKDDAD